MSGDEKFFNPSSGETLIHRERSDGTRDLFIEKDGATGRDHMHAVIGENGDVKYLRDFNGRLIADDKY